MGAFLRNHAGVIQAGLGVVILLLLVVCCLVRLSIGLPAH